MLGRAIKAASAHQARGREVSDIDDEVNAAMRIVARETQRRYREANKDKVSETKHRYYEANKHHWAPGGKYSRAR